METYTFSRALNMMRYSQSKMKVVTWGNTYIYYDGITRSLRSKDKCIISFTSAEILANWVEVKPLNEE